MFTASRNLVTPQQLQDASRSCRHETGETDRHTTHIDRMETIYILTVVDRFDNLLFWDMFRKRELYDKTIHVRIVVQFVHFTKKFFFGNIGFITDQRRFKTDLITCLDLTCDICFTSSIMTDQYGSQMRDFTTGSLDTGHFFRHLLLHLSRNGFSVQ